MMKRETLRNYRRTIGKFDRYSSVEMERQLIDSHLEALDKLEELTTVNRHLSGARCDLDCSYCRAGTEYGYLTGDDA